MKELKTFLIKAISTACKVSKQIQEGFIRLKYCWPLCNNWQLKFVYSLRPSNLIWVKNSYLLVHVGT